MQPQLCGVLHDLQADAPGVVDEGQLKQARHVAGRGGDLRPGRLQTLHRGVEIRHREADVIDDAARARCRLLVLLEDDPVSPNISRSGASVVGLPSNCFWYHSTALA
jgi:hypothetical protein